jgi:hypothetical protein
LPARHAPAAGARKARAGCASVPEARGSIGSGLGVDSSSVHV